jgi:alpha-L-rhamnosidase
MKRREFIKITTGALAAKLGAGTAYTEDEKQEVEIVYRAGIYPTKLRCEYRVDPLGIDVTEPRLSWVLQSTKLDARNQKQSAYRVIVATTLARLNAEDGDLWDTGKVDSEQSIHIRYDGKSLKSGQSAWWKVRSWDQDGSVSHWSSNATWSMGLLQSNEWIGKWIGINGGEEESEEFRGACWISDNSKNLKPLRFRKIFHTSEQNPVSYGQLAVVGSGDIAVFVNGTRVLPYSGKFPHDYVAYFITQMIHPGRNVVAIEVKPNATSAVVMAGIDLDLSNGQIQHVQTDERWKVSDYEHSGWEKLEFNDAAWDSANTTRSFPLLESAKAGERTRLPGRMLRKEFRLSDAIRKATAYISGLGYSELYINGSKVGDDVLTPALTDYDKRVFYLTYEVTDFLRPGDNAIGVLLGNGRFYAPRRYIPYPTRNFGYPKVLLQLEIEYHNGERIKIATDETWKVTTQGPIRANNDYDGEEYDARMEQDGWNSPAFHDKAWTAAQIVDPPSGNIRAQMSDPIRVMREVRPVKITQPTPEVYVFDMGQNIVGWCRLRVVGPTGTRITLRHAEALRPDGMLYLDNLRSARQMDVYTLNGNGIEVYEPRFTSHGFQYVEIRGFPGTPSLETLTGRVVNDAMEEHADFTTSSAVINHIYQNILWGDRGNYHSIPTDCPQRDERQGWLGDRSAESKGESFLFDVSNFYSQWVEEIADSMDRDGRINDVAPAYWPIYNENVVWPASFFIVPKMLYQQYGDIAVIHKHYPAMKRWIGHMRGLIKDDLMPVDVYGDWCVPPNSLTVIHSDDPAMQTAPEILGTAYFYYILRLMSEFAVISGFPNDQYDFDDLASRMKVAFHAKYFNPGKNLYGNGTQTSSVLPLALGLASDDHRKAIFDVLVNKIEVDTKGHLGTGLVGAQWLMQTLTENGRLDVAYQIASQTTYPGWGYMISRGATTIWELWNGDTADPAMNSRNHLMLVGDFCTWLYEDLAGIKSDQKHPGFKHVVIRPRIIEDLKFVRASHLSLYGKIATDWNHDGREFTLHVSIPPNTTATVYVPTNDQASVRESGRAAGMSKGVQFLHAMSDATVFEIGSGQYAFASKLR